MKKKFSSIFILVVSMLFLTGTAMAIQFIDLDSAINAPINLTTSYTGTFDIGVGDGGVGDVSGYNSLAYILDSAALNFSYKGDSNNGKLQYARMTLADYVWRLWVYWDWNEQFWNKFPKYL